VIAGARRDAGIFAFERSVPGDETVLVILNASDQASESCAPVVEGGACLHTSLPAGAALMDVMPGSDNTSISVKADGSVDVTVPAHSGRVLVKR
jgi:hypothetical protein